MDDDERAIRERRQKTWDDLQFLEQMADRSKRFLGTIPAHWQRARDLLYRDLLALVKSSK